MKAFLKFQPAALFALMISISGCDKKPASEPAHTEPAKDEKSAAKEPPGVKLDAETVRAIGLETVPVLKLPVPVDYDALGTVADPSALAALIAELAPAQVALETSRAERDRLKKLADAGNASLRSVQTAEAAYRRDEIFTESIRARLIMAWGDTLASRNDLPALLTSLSRRERALIRLELPVGVTPRSAPHHAFVASVNDDARECRAVSLGEAPANSGTGQGQAYLFLTDGHMVGFVPGALVTGRIVGDEAGTPSLVVPESALIRDGGKTAVYVATEQGRFVRVEVIPGRKSGSGRVITGDIREGASVVTTGALQLLSKEAAPGGEE